MTHSTRLAHWILLVFILTGTAGRAVAITGKRYLTHDEAISYISATGHASRHNAIISGESAGPYGCWIHADEWLRLLRIENKYCLMRIGDDLAHNDIHPPLYFWLLHFTCLALGTQLWTGLVVNAAIDLVALALLYRLARYVFNEALPATLTSLVWFLSPAVIACSMSGARQYALLALCTIGVSYFALRWLDHDAPPSRRNLVGAFLFGTAGALTHYHFAIVAAGIALLAALHSWRRHCWHGASLVAVLGLAYAAMMALHPHFYLALGRHQQQLQTADLAKLPDRIQIVIGTLGDFFCQYWRFELLVTPRYVMVVGLLFASIAAAVWRLTRRPPAELREQPAGHGDPVTGFRSRFVLFLAAWNGGVTILLYLAFVSQLHAMNSPYLAMTWPFLAFVPIMLLWQKNRFSRWVLAGICLATFFSGLEFATRSLREVPDQVHTAVFRDTRRVVANNSARGIFPHLIWNVPDECLVFIADGPYLLDHRELWLDALEPNDVIVSQPRARTTPSHEAEMLQLLRERFEVEELPKLPSPGRVFKLHARI